MDEKEIFLVKDDMQEELLEQELTDILQTVESMLHVSCEELSNFALTHHQQNFLHSLLHQVYLTKKIHQHIYCGLPENENHTEIFHLNPHLNTEKLSFELTSYIYQLNSLCYLGAFTIFTDLMHDHLTNVLTVVNNCTKKMVRLIDILNLRTLFMTT